MARKMSVSEAKQFTHNALKDRAARKPTAENKELLRSYEKTDLKRETIHLRSR
jgi:hypothetical protein